MNTGFRQFQTGFNRLSKNIGNYVNIFVGGFCDEKVGMNKQMKIIPEEIVGVVKIKEDSQFNKVQADKVIVDENVTARLFGNVNTVVLKRGAKLFLHGMIFGNVKNMGGELFIFK